MFAPKKMMFDWYDILFVGLLSLFLFHIGSYLLRRVVRSSVRHPPEPLGLPFIGHVLKIGKKPYISFQHLRESYGDVYRVRLLTTPVVVLNGYEAMHEAFCGQARVFAGRPEFRSWKNIANGNSLAFSTFSDSWRLQKKYSLHALFQYNDSIDGLENLINREADTAIQTLIKSQKLDPKIVLQDCVVTLVFSMLFGNNESNKAATRIIMEQLNIFRDSFDSIQVSDMLPKPLAELLLPKTSAVLHSVCSIVNDTVQGQMHASLSNYSGTIETVADSYIKTSLQIPEAGLENGFTRQQLVDSIQDVIGASVETTTHTLYFAVRYLVLYPDVQRKLQNELDQIISVDNRNDDVTIRDREKLPYVHATLTEILRHSCVLPITIPHCTTEDTTFRGYFIPKNTMIFGNIYSANMDPEVFDSPTDFRPERFLSPDGTFNKKLSEKIGAFGLGKRRCLGEMIANKILFILFVRMVVACEFEKDGEIDEDEHFHLTLYPTSYSVYVAPRNS